MSPLLLSFAQTKSVCRRSHLQRGFLSYQIPAVLKRSPGTFLPPSPWGVAGERTINAFSNLVFYGSEKVPVEMLRYVPTLGTSDFIHYFWHVAGKHDQHWATAAGQKSPACSKLFYMKNTTNTVSCSEGEHHIIIIIRFIFTMFQYNRGTEADIQGQIFQQPWHPGGRLERTNYRAEGATINCLVLCELSNM